MPGEKLLLKLWETLVEKGVVSLLSPWQKIRDGRALNIIRREEMLTIAQAEVDAKKIREGSFCLDQSDSLRLIPKSPAFIGSNILNLEDRIEPYISFEAITNAVVRTNITHAIRKEINVSKAIIHSEEILASDTQTPPEQSIDADWLFGWRDYVGNISNADLQQLWGKILAGEVKSPGRYPLRTLDCLRLISKDEAELITKLGSFVIVDQIVCNSPARKLLDEKGVSFEALLNLQEIGMLTGVDSMGLGWEGTSKEPDKFYSFVYSNNKALEITHEDPKKISKLTVYALTSIGKDIIGLGEFPADIEYLCTVGKIIAKQGFLVKLADWKLIEGLTGTLSNFEKIDI